MRPSPAILRSIALFIGTFSTTYESVEVLHTLDFACRVTNSEIAAILSKTARTPVGGVMIALTVLGLVVVIIKLGRKKRTLERELAEAQDSRAQLRRHKRESSASFEEDEQIEETRELSLSGWKTTRQVRKWRRTKNAG